MNATPSSRRYRIRVRGHPDDHWFRSVDGLTVARLPNGEALLTGWLVDQAALHGLLNRIGDLGLDLLSVEQDSDLV